MAERKIKISERKSAHADLSDFCVFANKDDGAYVEVTDWTNHEGYDVSIHTRNRDETFMLSHGEFDALAKIIKELRK